ncbi:MAG: aquaporin [Oscillospiraceae bacterium]|nr:aquaporin [Oscillospiraceae bacterium]
MTYLSEFIGSLIFLLGGYAYMCNVNLKKTLVGKLNYIELAVAWSLAVGFGLAVAVILGGPAYLNPGVVFGNLILGNVSAGDAALYILMEFLAAGAAVIICMVFFWDSFKATPEGDKRGIFSAYPVSKNYALNIIQEILATFLFLFLVLGTITAPGTDAFRIGVVGFAAVLILSLTLNSTGFSMNAMRSFFSSIWFAVMPIPNKGAKVDWAYQLIVNLIASSIGGILAVVAVHYLFTAPAA